MKRLPLVHKRVVWHLGSRQPKDKKPSTSHEGFALSVSEYPEEWSYIAKIGLREVWKLTSRRIANFLDVHALTKDQKTKFTALATEAGLLKRERRWKVTGVDPDTGRKFWSYSSSEEEANAEADMIEDETGSRGVVQAVLLSVPTDSLMNLWSERYDGGLPEMLGKTVAWQVVVERDYPTVDGFWWNDELDPYSLSAPRGGIFYSRLGNWTWSPSSVEEAERLRSNPDERRVVCSWCGVKISGPDDPNANVSHGCCAACKPKVEEQIRTAHEEIRRRKAAKDEPKKNPPEIDDVLRGRSFWHGASTEEQGRFTLKSGIVPKNAKQGRGLMAPVAGRSYLTPDLAYGVIYAIGADMAGDSLPSSYIEKNGRYGYLFEVSGDDLLGRDVQPDEDSIGDMLNEGLEDSSRCPLWLLDLARRNLTSRQLRNVRDGLYAYYAASGKKLVRLMSPWQKAELIRRGAHVAVTGGVMLTRAWRIDKLRSPELKKDGSNFFEIAEVVPLVRANDPGGWWVAVHPYVSPRERELTPREAWVRAIAYGIKNGDESAIRTAVRDMAPLIPEGSYVVPAPSSRAWSYGGVAKLAEELAKTIHGIYAEPVARRFTVPSSHERRRSGGKGLTVEEHLASMESRMRGKCPEGRPVVLVDNVATSGATLEATRRLIGENCDVRAVVWAEARDPERA